jgi:hypothetical protein
MNDKSKQSLCGLNNPDLVGISVIVPLNDVLFILAFALTDIKTLSATALEVEGVLSVELFHSLDGHQLPKLISLLVRLAAVNSGAVVHISDFNGKVVEGTENSIFTISNSINLELLVGDSLILINDKLVVICLVLRNIKDKLVVQS